MPILEDEEVAKLIMESRFPAADAKDAALYRSMRKKGFISTIELDFADPAKEHRLWVPDQILGAYSDTAVGLQSAEVWKREWDTLKDSVTAVKASLLMRRSRLPRTLGYTGSDFQIPSRGRLSAQFYHVD